MPAGGKAQRLPGIGPAKLRAADGKEDAERRIFNAVGRFLFDHRLEPSPANYLLAYKLVTRTNAAAVAAVEQATSDGVRLSQGEADRIMKAAGVRLEEFEASYAGPAEAMEEANRQLEIVETIVGTTQAHAARYGRDLELTAAQLRAVSEGDPLEDLLRITANMLARTREAESQLQSTTSEVQSLRRELASISEEARTDALTGLANRRALEDRLAWLQRSGLTFSAAICDIDHFKAINDGHGHPVGDRVLKAVAGVLEASCPGHMVARYGGEEFVVLLAATRASAAAALIESARAELAGRRFKVRETGEEIGAVTFSAGIADARPAEPWPEIVNRADAMLYRAKRRGRNRVELDAGGAEGGGE